MTLLPRVCYMGAYRPDYPRNLILRHGLQLAGAEVVECRVPVEWRTLARMRGLLRQFPATADHCDVIVLAEFCQDLAPAAWWLSRRYGKRLVVDAFTSLYDSAVSDRQTAGARSLAALRYRISDALALWLADRLITDTAQHVDYFRQAYGVPGGKMTAIPVGASREWFDAPALDADPVVQFYGTYIPLHGIETILHAARMLPQVRFDLIGKGQTFAAMRALAESLALENVSFREPVPPEHLPAEVAKAAVCLGIFGTTDKASRVVPNKVYQCMALGKPVITADTPALRALFTPGEHLLAVPPGDAAALAEAIRRLLGDEALRLKLGSAARAVMQAEFDEAALGRQLLEVTA